MRCHPVNNLNVGQRFGRLVVKEKLYTLENNHRRLQWCCSCDCGNTVVVRSSSLLKKKRPQVSCGCYHKELREYGCNTIHGASYTREYSIWKGILARCSNEKKYAFKYYGALEIVGGPHGRSRLETEETITCLRLMG